MFNLFSERHRKGTIVVTSNLAFGEWAQVLGGNEKLTAALLDRLAETAPVITTSGQSFRSQKRTATAKVAQDSPIWVGEVSIAQTGPSSSGGAIPVDMRTVIDGFAVSSSAH